NLFLGCIPVEEGEKFRKKSGKKYEKNKKKIGKFLEKFSPPMGWGYGKIFFSFFPFDNGDDP
ncbi:MAG: hypothetical protein QXP36_06555, partial [Conexivisphaerales archaeon]